MASDRDRQALEELAQLGAQVLGKVFNLKPDDPDPAVCFAVLTFSPGEDGWASYASNARRPDMVKALREMADVLEHGRDRH